MVEQEKCSVRLKPPLIFDVGQTAKTEMNRNRTELAGWMLVAVGVLLFAGTLRTQDQDLSIRLKLEATGVGPARDAGHAYRHVLRPAASVAFGLGVVCLAVCGVQESRNRRRRKDGGQRDGSPPRGGSPPHH
jgi:hypothetical protein